MEAQRDAAVVRETELSDELRRARQAAERAAWSGEDDVIAVEKSMRASHEREVASLQDRACRAEQRVRKWFVGEGWVCSGDSVPLNDNGGFW